MIMTRKRMNEEIGKALETENEKRCMYERMNYLGDRIGKLENEIRALREKLYEMGATNVPNNVAKTIFAVPTEG